MTVLVLGGTTEGRFLATALHDRGLPVIYSLAGRVRQTVLPCEVISGGFSQWGGLEVFLRERNIRGVVDATHPYAAAISRNAARAARARDLPCWRYHRPAWQPEAGDDWRRFSDWRTLAMALAGRRSVFITAGQVPPEAARQLSHYQAQGQRQWVRTAVPPAQPLLGDMRWIQDIGPFTAEAEYALFRRFGFDALVSKNSGGAATAAKIRVARELRVPVYMLERPELEPVTHEFDDIAECERALCHWYSTRSDRHSQPAPASYRGPRSGRQAHSPGTTFKQEDPL